MLIQRVSARRTAPRDTLLVLALLAYVVTGGILPAGHMAAPLESGTAFHLCPGDARSALIIDALVSQPGHHHHHHHHQAADTGDPAESGDPGTGCTLAGTAVALANLAAGAAVGDDSGLPWLVDRPRAAAIPTPWLRPPARSPPA